MRTLFTERDFSERRKALAHGLEAAGIDWVYVSPGSDYRYLTGIAARRSERPQALLLSRAGDEALLCPAFEADYIRSVVAIDRLITWEEHANPFVKAAEHLGGDGGALRIGMAPGCSFDEYAGLDSAIPGARIVEAKSIIRGMRAVKSEREIALMREVTRLTDETLEEAIREDFVAGITESQFSRSIVDRGLGRGLQSANATVLSGPNSSFPHGGTGDRTMDEGEVILVDLVATLHGYHADITRTVVFGKPVSTAGDVYSVVEEAARRGAESISPGELAEEPDGVARRIIDEAGYGKHFIHRLGHGLGLDVHEDPYLVSGNDGRSAPAYSHVDVHGGMLAENMVLTVEPGIYLEGEFGIRIEDDALVTADGCELLTRNVDRPFIL